MKNINQDVKVGVVIPVYKTKYAYLKECVDSVINQTYTNLQIILVDDCSPDDCGKWCDDFAKIDERIEVCHHDVNKKLPNARNTGIEHLNAEYVTFLDSDDWLNLDTIEKCMACIANCNNKVDFAFFPICRNYKNTETEANFSDISVFSGRDSFGKLQLESLQIAKKHRVSDYGMNDGAWGKIIRTNLLKDNGIVFRDLAYREDGMFYMEICQASNYALAIPDGKYHYRETSDSMVNSYRKNAPQEQKAYITALIEFGKIQHKSRVFFEAIDYYMIVSVQTAIVQCYCNKNNSSACKHAQCLQYIKQEPYKTGLKKIQLTELNSHFFVKALLIKLHCFSMVEKLRRLYLKKNSMECFN